MKIRLTLVCLMLLTAFSFRAEVSASRILDKAVAKLSKASSVNCKFRISADNQNLNGSFKSTGRKFHLDTPVSTTWYDGKNMWTSNPKTKEITLVNPNSQEINEVNPFAYLSSYKHRFITGMSKRRDNDRYLVLLNPRDRKDQIKAIEVAVNKKTFLPERFIIRDRNDKVTTVYVNALSLSTKNADSQFVCPVNSMSDYEFVDLR